MSAPTPAEAADLFRRAPGRFLDVGLYVVEGAGLFAHEERLIRG